MTLIFEIAGGIVLAVAIIALAVAFWEGLAIGLAIVVGLAIAVAGAAVLYSICGSWENVALVTILLGTIGAAIGLIEFFNAHEKYGLAFRAVGNAISAGAILSTFASVIVWLPICILLEGWKTVPYLYSLIPLAAVTWLVAGVLSYRHFLQKEMGAVLTESV